MEDFWGKLISVLDLFILDGITGDSFWLNICFMRSTANGETARRVIKMIVETDLTIVTMKLISCPSSKKRRKKDFGCLFIPLSS